MFVDEQTDFQSKQTGSQSWQLFPPSKSLGLNVVRKQVGEAALAGTQPGEDSAQKASGEDGDPARAF